MFFQGHLAAGRGCDSWWEGQQLGCDHSAIAGNCSALAGWEVYSYSAVGGRDEEERSESLAHTTWEKENSKFIKEHARFHYTLNPIGPSLQV